MAQRRLSLELDLDSGSFTAKMRGAGAATEVFSKKIDVANESLRRIDKGVNGATAKLRDFTLVMGNLRSAVENARFFFTGLVEAAVSATSEIERTIFLLRGLSKEATAFGRRQEATKNLEGLIATAKSAPFALSALTDTFVKFKAGGLDPTNGSMQALLDSVAAFGGSDEILKRAAVAIQQMGGKGVISMEELRQQLGEAVPTAIELMAKGLGKSYFDLVDEISKGKVKAGPALAAMFEQMKITYGGSSAAMMETFRGKVSQLKTSLVELAMAFTGMDTAGNVKDGSFYDYLKKTVEGLTQMIGSEGFKSGIADLGTTFGQVAEGVGTFLSIAQGIKDTLPAFIDLKGVIGLLAAAITGQLIARAGAELSKFIGQSIRGSRDMIVSLRSEQRARIDAARSAVDGARLERFAAEEAVVASERKIAALNAEKAALQSVVAMETRRLQAGANQAMTGRDANGKFAPRAAGEAQRVYATNALADAGRRLAAVEAQIVAVDAARANASARVTAAQVAETAAVAQSTAVGRARIAVNGVFVASLAAINRGLLAAATGTRAFGIGLVALTTAQGRYNAGLMVGNGLLATMRVGMIAGTVAARGLMMALSFFGGPLGIAILGIAAAIMSVAGAARQAEENTKSAMGVFEENNAILNRMGQEGILAAEGVKAAGDNSADAAEGINQVAASAMAGATNLRDYAAAAREAAIAELDLQIIKTRGEVDKAYAGTSAGRAQAVADANRRRSGANGERTMSDTWASMGERWDYRMGQLRNRFWDGGATDRSNQRIVDEGNRQISNLLNRQTEIRFSTDDRYARAFAARAPVGGGSADTSSGGGGRKTGSGQTVDERGMETALGMLERVQGIEAEIAGAGKEAAKLTFLLNTDPELSKASQEIKDNMIAAATALDIANERMEGFRAFESLTETAKEQEESVTRLRAEMDLIAAGQSDMVVENARYRAGLSETVSTAEKFTTEAEAMADRAARAQRTFQQMSKQRDAMLDLQRAVTSTGLAADAAWEDFSSGALESDRELNRYRRSLSLMLAQIPAGTEDWVRMKAAMDAALDNYRLERAAEAMIEMRNATREVERSLMTTGQAAQAAFQEEADRYWQIVLDTKEGTAERQQAEATYYAWKAAKEREIAMSNPIASMALEWVDVMGNLQQATTGWIDGLVDGLVEGKMNFKEFAASMLKEIAKIILRALIAKTVLSALGLGGFGGYGPNGASDDLIGLFHTGGIVGSGPAPQSRRVDASMFNAAPRMHTGGIVGGLKAGEVPTILKKKEGVFTPEQMASLAPVGSGQTAPNVQVNVINQSGQDLDAQQSGGGMKFDGRSYILDVVIDAASKPGKMRDALKGVAGR